MVSSNKQRSVVGLFRSLLWFVIVTAVFFVQGTISLAAEYRNVTPRQAAELLAKLPEVQLVDVRTPEEYQNARLENAVLVPIRQVFSGKHQLAKDKPVLLYCAVGGRSYFAAKILSENGFAEVYNMTGGIKRWYQDGLPLIINN